MGSKSRRKYLSTKTPLHRLVRRLSHRLEKHTLLIILLPIAIGIGGLLVFGILNDKPIYVGQRGPAWW